MRTSKFLIVSEFAAQTAVSGRRLLIGAALGVSLAAFGVAGCHSNTATTTPPADGSTNPSDPNAPDPTAANSAPVDNSGGTQVAGYQQQAQPSQQTYTNPAPVERRQPSGDQGYSDQNYNNSQDDNAEQGYNATLSDIQAPQPPPPLPEYSQPEDPDPNYIWTPGYWSYTPQGYYWVPGAWTEPPYTGALWTPGYWGGYGNGYRFHHGFWAAHIGFYGGINYGFGYVGTGYQGGYWNGNTFYYNQYANHIDENRIHNVYQRNVVVNNTVINNRVVNNTTYNNTTVNNTRINTVSYNGGRGGVQAAPRPAELAVLREQRTPPMQAQLQVAKVASTNPQQFYAKNQGRPAEVAAAKPLPADRGIPAPPHTTAEINRAAPPQEQLRQHQEAFKQTVAPQARPAVTPQQQNRPAPAEPQRPVPAQTRPGTMNPPNRQPEARPAPGNNQANHPEPAARPQPQAKPQPQIRPQPQAPVRPQPQARPQPEARPQPQPQARPQPPAHQEEAKPKPEPHAQAAPRPQPQQRPHAEPAHPEHPGAR